MTRTVHKTCNLCEASCGLLLDVSLGRVTSIRPDEEDVLSRGHICPKAFTLQEIHEDPDRLRRPVRRTRGGAWEEVSWDAALDLAASGIARIQRRHGRDAVASYIGNPVAHSFGTGLGSLALLGALASRSRFSTNSVDSNPKLLSSLLLFGSMVALPVPDLDRTSYLLILGANPVVSNGSVVTAPGIRARLRGIQARGGKVVVLDPRRTETARIADEHIFIRPGEDALLLAGIVHVILDERLGRETPATARISGKGALAAALAPLAPERTEARLCIPATTVRRLARELCAAPAAACYGRTGTCNQEFGALSTWLIEVVNVVSGNLDREGGAMFPTPAVDLRALASLIRQRGHHGRWRSRVRGALEFNDEIPVACLAEEILTPEGAEGRDGRNENGRGKEGPRSQVRGLVTIAANPVLSVPNGRLTDRALASLECYVAVDIYRNESTRHAHVILPPAWSLEQEAYEALSLLLTVRNVAKVSPPVLPPAPGTRRDFEVLTDLALRVVERRTGGPLGGLAAALRRSRALPSLSTILDIMLRAGPHGDRFLPWSSGLSLAKLRRHPHGVDLGPLVPSLDRVLETRDRRIPLDQPTMRAEIERLAARASAPAPDGLLLIGRRDIRTNNSWAHNAPSMVVGRPRCTLIMHPQDALRLGLADGEIVRITSRAGSVTAPLVVKDEVMPGVVSLPHGWGHERAGDGLRVAATQPGVSANDLTDEQAIDPVIGNAVLNGVPVRVERDVDPMLINVVNVDQHRIARPPV